MLSKKDLQAIRTIIQEELKELVMRDIVMEKAPRKPGDPPKHTEKLTVNVIDEIAKYMPHVEGAIRGVQHDVNVNNNSQLAVAKTLLSLRKGFHELQEVTEQKKIA